MNGAGDQFLTRTGLATDENGGVSGRYALHLARQPLEGRGVSDNVLTQGVSLSFGGSIGNAFNGFYE
jgi:hypothetical protein